MTRRENQAAARLLVALAGNARARIVREGGKFRMELAGTVAGAPIADDLVRRLVAGGLLVAASGGFMASPAAGAWLARRGESDRPFLAQHAEIVAQSSPDGGGETVLANAAESPVSLLARRTDRNGRPWLSPHALDAAERLRRDFEQAGLQPHVTSNWSAAVNSGRRGGSGGADLTDFAVDARRRFSEAMNAVGPDLSGILTDICCFLKGLETAERERGWPARSGKLVLRIALESLARHYGLSSSAEASRGARRMRHWGASDYRPNVS